MKTSELVCAVCGANLRFEEGKERAICGYCGAQSLLVQKQAEATPVPRKVRGYSAEFFAAALADADPEALKARCARYVESVQAYLANEGTHDEPMMRSVEETIDVPEEGKDEFRRGIKTFIDALAIEGRSFEYATSENFHRALAACLYVESSTLDEA